MLVFTVISQPLAVIGEKDHETAAVEVLLLQEVEEAADDRVRGRDLSVVGMRRVARAERLGGSYGVCGS